MNSHSFGLIELLSFFGLVLALGFYELYKLRRTQKQDEKSDNNRAATDKSATPRHTERQ